MAVQHLKQAHDAVKAFKDLRDVDLCFLPQKVYNAWFDLDFQLKKLGEKRKPLRESSDE